MRILHLAPPSARDGRIAAHTFIDEDIPGLQRAGTESFTMFEPVPGRAPNKVLASSRSRRLPAPFAAAAHDEDRVAGKFPHRHAIVSA
jgi:hypothetical protein